MSKRKLVDFLVSPAGRLRSTQVCRTCSNPRLAKDVVAFLDGLRDGTIVTSFGAFHERYVLAEYTKAPCRTALREHIVKCLRRDIRTGKPIK